MFLCIFCLHDTCGQYLAFSEGVACYHYCYYCCYYYSVAKVANTADVHKCLIHLQQCMIVKTTHDYIEWQVCSSVLHLI